MPGKPTLQGSKDLPSTRLTFKKGNAKLGPDTTTFTLPAGHTCPGAATCLAKVVKNADGSRKLVDGPQQEVRCYAAALEIAFSNIHDMAWRNMDVLREAKTEARMKAVILRDLPVKATKVRVHVGGDFWSQAYFNAWMEVALSRPEVTFYAYTKSIIYWRGWLAANYVLPPNFKLVASDGGKFDALITQDMVTVTIVDHPDTAEAMGLEVDHDDSHAVENEKSFALIVHGVQRAGSDAADAIKVLKKEEVQYAYARR